MRASKQPPAPAPAPERRGLFFRDRAANLVVGVAIGLLVTILPARQLARQLERERMAAPLDRIEAAIDEPLAVEAELPDEAAIDEIQRAARQRYLLVWLLVGVPVGLGLGVMPRWW